MIEMNFDIKNYHYILTRNRETLRIKEVEFGVK